MSLALDIIHKPVSKDANFTVVVRQKVYTYGEKKMAPVWPVPFLVLALKPFYTRLYYELCSLTGVKNCFV